MQNKDFRSPRWCALLLIALLLASMPNQPVAAQTTAIPLSLQWSSDESDPTTSVAWGDVDNDGDLDLAVGNGNFATTVNDRFYNRIYCNTNGQLTPCWQAPEPDITLSVAWGDVDNDNDLDLAVGNGAVSIVGEQVGNHNRLYRNDGIAADGQIRLTAIWTSTEKTSSTSLAWYDYNHDGYLDLAVANGSRSIIGERNVEQAVQLYCNQHGTLTTTACWTSAPETYFGTSVAWGDMNNDGFADLAVGTDGPNRIFCNDGVTLTPCWQSDDSSTTLSVDWGDFNRDGYLDLATGNGDTRVGEQNHIYCNVQGRLQSSPCWTSVESDTTLAVAWGDVNNDGYLDLATGNGNFSSDQPIRLYCNHNGVLAQEACPFPVQAEVTKALAWGDVDNDGDLDLATGNISYPNGKPNRLYRNDSKILSEQATWSGAPNYSRSIAWGDYDRDEDLDLLVGNGGFSQLYQNDQGSLGSSAIWTATTWANTRVVAWADMDGDGDLDFAVGNDGPNQLYRNDTQASGTPTFTLIFTFPDTEDTRGLAWGDYDGDGDLDLFFGNSTLDEFDKPVGQVSHLYRNDGTVDNFTTFTLAWQSPVEATRGAAWGDLDNDGDLDLAVANADQPGRLYRNDGVTAEGQPLFTLVWSPADLAVDGSSVDWGDLDGDGDLDLAMGAVHQSNRIYCNQDGMLTTNWCWRSQEAERTRSLVWGDVDGDGDLDLAAGNQEGVNHLYRNDGGQLTTVNVWASAERDFTWQVAWGDLDKDGDLDLAAANSEWQPIRIYQNRQRNGASPTQMLPYAQLPQPGVAADAYFFASAERLAATEALVIPYQLYAPTGAPVREIIPEFSPNGGGQWLPTTDGSGGDGRYHLTTAPWPQGAAHTYVWNAKADIIKADQVRFRLRVKPGYRYGPIYWADLGSQSPPFRLEAPWYIKVVNETQNPQAGAAVYAQGALQGYTNRAGLLNPAAITGQPVALAALAAQDHFPGARGHHEQGAYTIYTTSFTTGADGALQPYQASSQGEQRLVVQRQQPLLLYHLVVSLEWRADLAFMQEVAAALRAGSDYLLDLTDGQLALGSVTIYNDRQQWTAADIQIVAANTLQPHAYVGGLRSTNPNHVIRLSRQWNGINGNSGRWDHPAGFRTIMHEFGHYGLQLYDEYIGFLRDAQGAFIGQVYTFCTGPENRDPTKAATNASAMDSQYYATEFSDQGLPGPLWNERCLNAAHAQLTALETGRAESVWETIVRVLADPQSPPRWQLRRPAQRGQVMAGPDALPGVLPSWPITTVVDPAPTRPQLHLIVLGPTSDGTTLPYGDAFVTLYKENGAKLIEQGRTDADGKLAIYGADPGDLLRAMSLDNRFSGSVLVTTANTLTIHLEPAFDRAAAQPAATGVVYHALAAGVTTTGASEAQRLFADDGNLSLFVPGHALSSATTLTIERWNSTPHPIPAGATLVSPVYHLSSSAETQSAQPLLLQIRPTGLRALAQAPRLHRWDAAGATWQPVSDAFDAEAQTVDAAVHHFGFYALLTPSAPPGPLNNQLFLPLVANR